MNKALFLDRDGIINQDSAYPHKPEQIEFIDEIFELCKTASSKGYMLIVVTNQAGVARGYFTEDDVRKLHQWMSEQFQLRGIILTAFYYCPFHPKGKIEKYRQDSDCRKPAPGMILQAVKDYNIDIKSSLMVGDKPSDRIKMDDLRCIIVKSQYTDNDYDVENLLDVCKYLG